MQLVNRINFGGSDFGFEAIQIVTLARSDVIAHFGLLFFLFRKGKNTIGYFVVKIAYTPEVSRQLFGRFMHTGCIEHGRSFAYALQLVVDTRY